MWNGNDEAGRQLMAFQHKQMNPLLYLCRPPSSVRLYRERDWQWSTLAYQEADKRATYPPQTPLIRAHFDAHLWPRYFPSHNSYSCWYRSHPGRVSSSPLNLPNFFKLNTQQLRVWAWLADCLLFSLRLTWFFLSSSLLLVPHEASLRFCSAVIKPLVMWR